jgi:ubiquinone/menaquinone biosynthesis C-methylase UbiE
VIGVDASPEMLALARARVPGADFHEGDLDQLPVPDRHADVLVCALALTHIPNLAPVLAEFARVLRPGGHLVLSDSRTDRPVVTALSDGSFGCLPHWNHLASDYLAAALPLGFQVRRCDEPRLPYPTIDPNAKPPASPPGHPSDIWSLWPWCPAAVNAAYRDTPLLIVWDFQLGGC